MSIDSQQLSRRLCRAARNEQGHCGGLGGVMGDLPGQEGRWGLPCNLREGHWERPQELPVPAVNPMKNACNQSREYLNIRAVAASLGASLQGVEVLLKHWQSACACTGESHGGLLVLMQAAAAAPMSTAYPVPDRAPCWLCVQQRVRSQCVS